MLEGSLRSFNLFEILQFLRLGGMNGILSVSREDERIQLMFREGKIVNSSVFTHRQRLGELLLVRGAISRRDIDDILEGQRKGEISAPLGQALLDLGLLDQETLAQTLRLQLEEEIWSLMGWDDGEFRFDPSDSVVETAPSIIEIEIEPLIIEGVRRQDEWKTITQHIGDDHAVPVPLPPETHHEPDNSLTQSEWRLLSIINGALTVGSIVDRSGLGRFETYRILANFIQQAWITCEPYLQAEERTSEAASRRAGDPTFASESAGDNGSGRTWWKKASRDTRNTTIADNHRTPVSLAAALANEMLRTVQRRRIEDPWGCWPMTPLVWQRLTNRFPAADGIVVVGGLLDTDLFDRQWAVLTEPTVRALLIEDTWAALVDLTDLLAEALAQALPPREWNKLCAQLVTDLQASTVEEVGPLGMTATELVLILEHQTNEEVSPINGR
jgi:Domain of unknown function (DUF4388)